MQIQMLNIQQQIMQLPVREKQDLHNWLDAMVKEDQEKSLTINKSNIDAWDMQMKKDADDGYLDFLFDEVMEEKKSQTRIEL